MVTLENINDRINFRSMLEQFMDIMIERFEHSIRKKKVGNSKNATGELIRSFKKAMLYSGNNINKASVTFLAYGRMQDMGVGRGINLNNQLYARQWQRRTGERPLRKRKPWYSKTKSHEIKRFRELMIKQFGTEMVSEVEQQLTDTLTLNNLL